MFQSVKIYQLKIHVFHIKLLLTQLPYEPCIKTLRRKCHHFRRNVLMQGLEVL